MHINTSLRDHHVMIEMTTSGKMIEHLSIVKYLHLSVLEAICAWLDLYSFETY